MVYPPPPNTIVGHFKTSNPFLCPTGTLNKLKKKKKSTNEKRTTNLDLFFFGSTNNLYNV